MPRRPVFVPNQSDNLHCLQACYIMTRDALGLVPCSMEIAERSTGFFPGRPTWQFKMLSALADDGFWCTDAEPFNPIDFVTDPVATIQKQVGDEAVAAEVLGAMDVDVEVRNLSRCLDKDDQISFINTAPVLADVQQILDLGGVALCNLNIRVLHEEEGYEGSMVLVEETAEKEHLVIQDPGLPPKPNAIVRTSQFEAAWRYPSPSMANVIGVFSDSSVWLEFNSSLKLRKDP